MTKPREKTREELQAEIEDGKKKIRQLENREKIRFSRRLTCRKCEQRNPAVSSGCCGCQFRGGK